MSLTAIFPHVAGDLPQFPGVHQFTGVRFVPHAYSTFEPETSLVESRATGAPVALQKHAVCVLVGTSPEV